MLAGQDVVINSFLQPRLHLVIVRVAVLEVSSHFCNFDGCPAVSLQDNAKVRV